MQVALWRQESESLSPKDAWVYETRKAQATLVSVCGGSGGGAEELGKKAAYVWEKKHGLTHGKCSDKKGSPILQVLGGETQRSVS